MFFKKKFKWKLKQTCFIYSYLYISILLSLSSHAFILYICTTLCLQYKDAILSKSATSINIHGIKSKNLYNQFFFNKEITQEKQCFVPQITGKMKSYFFNIFKSRNPMCPINPSENGEIFLKRNEKFFKNLLMRKLFRQKSWNLKFWLNHDPRG